jgi:hypothetical protein
MIYFVELSLSMVIIGIVFLLIKKPRNFYIWIQLEEISLQFQLLIMHFFLGSNSNILKIVKIIKK